MFKDVQCTDGNHSIIQPTLSLLQVLALKQWCKGRLPRRSILQCNLLLSLQVGTSLIKPQIKINSVYEQIKTKYLDTNKYMIKLCMCIQLTVQIIWFA